MCTICVLHVYFMRTVKKKKSIWRGILCYPFNFLLREFQFSKTNKKKFQENIFFFIYLHLQKIKMINKKLN